ncbi:MAG: bifunctional riboflavin kinase/FAD synthetase [Chloroflexota bacterium]|nr:bifunctional riboflavin kinase/FAD synthetase [Chloroflexota bacterium]
MLIEEELSRVSPKRETALTIGVFDGVHLGHQLLINKVKEKAAADNLESGVVTFLHHPRLVLGRQSQITFITSIEERIQMLKALGLDHVIALSFTTNLSHLGARDFITSISRHLKLRELVIGPDFALGKEREGNAEALRSLGDDLGFQVEVVPPLLYQGEIVSSTAIRGALARGEISKMNKFLGRRFTLNGQVEHGDSRGKTLGYPTANLIPVEDQALPADGVYAAYAVLDDASYNAVLNIGVRPTFRGEHRLIEVHLLNFDGDIYGQELKIELVDRLRDEMKFPGPDELKAQLIKDVDLAKVLLERSKTAI